MAEEKARPGKQLNSLIGLLRELETFLETFKTQNEKDFDSLVVQEKSLELELELFNDQRYWDSLVAPRSDHRSISKPSSLKIPTRLVNSSNNNDPIKLYHVRNLFEIKFRINLLIAITIL